MNIQGQRLCVWSGILSIFVFFIGFWPLAKFFPPLSPALNAQQIADIYLGNAAGIRLGAICFVYSAGLLIPFYGVISLLRCLPSCHSFRQRWFYALQPIARSATSTTS
jgi:hypothetical protein